MTDDNIDEPDTETFSIVLSTSDTDDGRLNGDHTSLNVVINDDPNDLPPYVFFNEENQYIDETDGDLVVTVNLSLHAGSGFQDPSIPIQVSTDPEKSTATASGTYADHNLVSRVITFDGAVGDQNQSFTFTITGDTFDEGPNNSDDHTETIYILSLIHI